MKKWGLVIMVFFLILGGAGCEKAPPEEDSIKIGLSFDTFVVERWNRELEVLVSRANELGAEVVVKVANEDVEKQKEQIKAMIDEGVDVLVVVPNDVTALQDVVTQAHEKGIKIISYDRLIKQAPVDLYLSFDNVKTGEMMAQSIVDQCKADYDKRLNAEKTDDNEKLLSLDNLPVDESAYHLLIINGDPKDNNSALINEGFHKVIDPYVASEKVVVIDEIWAPEWREKYARDLVETTLKSGIKIDGILAGNDILASGAIETLSKWQLAGEVYVVGQDAELSACQRIVEGTQLSTIYKDINALAKSCAAYALELGEKGSIDADDTMYNGEMNVPYIKLDIKLVTADSLYDTIIRTGFHNENDVYLNEKEDLETSENQPDRP